MLLVRLLPQTVYSNLPPPRPAFSFSTDSLRGLTDGVFIFEAVSTEDSKTMQGYDAIVVEQWTVLDVSVGIGSGAFLVWTVIVLPARSSERGCCWMSLSSERQLDLHTPCEDPFRPLVPLLCHPQLGDGPHFSLSVEKTHCVSRVEKILLSSI